MGTGLALGYRIKKWAPDWRIILSAVLIVLSFPPFNFSFLIWICLIPWFFALRRVRSMQAALVQGIWLSFFMTVFGFYWVAFVLQEFGNLPWIVAFLALFLFGTFAQPQFILFSPIFYVLARGRLEISPSHDSKNHRHIPTLLSLGFAFFYAGLDWILPKLWTDTLGHAFYASQYFKQAADLGGAALLTVVVYLTNDLLWSLIDRLRSRKEPSYWPTIRFVLPQALIAISAILAVEYYGVYRLKFLGPILDQPIDTLQVGVIQGNIGDFDKLASETGSRGAARKILETFFTMSDQALRLTPKPEVLVWPETSYPSTFRTPQNTDELFRDQSVEHYVKDRKFTLLFGGYDRYKQKDYNAFFFLSPHGESSLGSPGDLQIYRKNILLLFGEYIPGMESIKFLREQFPQIGNFGRGEGPSVLKIYRDVSLGAKHPTELPAISVGPIICYEALFPNYVIASANLGSQLIMNITNDSWFGPWGEPELHLALTTFRSIETRLPQLRSTNTGISALITATGDMPQQTGIGKAEIMNVKVPITPPIWTLMKSWGDWFGRTAFVLGIIFLFFGYRKQTLINKN